MLLWCGMYLSKAWNLQNRLVILGPNPGPYLDPCWSWENSIICPAISRSCKLGYRLFRKSSKSLLLPEGITSDMPYRKREEEKRVLLGLKRLEALLALRYLASAPGAAEMYLPLPFVSPPVGYTTEKPESMLRGTSLKRKKHPSWPPFHKPASPHFSHATVLWSDNSTTIVTFIRPTHQSGRKHLHKDWERNIYFGFLFVWWWFCFNHWQQTDSKVVL